VHKENGFTLTIVDRRPRCISATPRKYPQFIHPAADFMKKSSASP
jgi:hypothetical protein